MFSGTLADILPRLGVQNKVRVRVGANQEKAVELLSALPPIRAVEVIDDYISVTFHEGEEGDGLIARSLVKAKFDLVFLQPEKLKLDDAFLQLTKGMVH